MALDLPAMPMGLAAQQPLASQSTLPQLRPPGAATPPPAAAGAMQAPITPPPGQPEESPYQVRLQPDGSSVYYLPGPTPQQEIILGVNNPPKLPKALQQPAA